MFLSSTWNQYIVLLPLKKLNLLILLVPAGGIRTPDLLITNYAAPLSWHSRSPHLSA